MTNLNSAPPGTDPDDRQPDPAWQPWAMRDPTRFISLLGPVEARLVDGVAHIRMFPEQRHSNMRDKVHGGTTAGFIDVALFAASRIMGLTTSGTAVTLDLTIQYMGEGRIDEPLEAHVELLKETGRLLFLRGLIVQRDERVAAFSGTIRKPSKKPPATA